MKCGMYLSRNLLSACTVLPARGHLPCGVCCRTKETISISACCREILLLCTACVRPDYKWEHKCQVQLHNLSNHMSEHIIVKQHCKSEHVKYCHSEYVLSNYTATVGHA